MDSLDFFAIVFNVKFVRILELIDLLVITESSNLFSFFDNQIFMTTRKAKGIGNTPL
jgi:hypothetical protein